MTKIFLAVWSMIVGAMLGHCITTIAYEKRLTFPAKVGIGALGSILLVTWIIIVSRNVG